jgi:hypothetical protein
MPTYEPQALRDKVEKEKEGVTLQDLFNNREHNRLLEMWCAAEFGVGYSSIVRPCQIQIENEDEQREYDFQLIFEDTTELVQLAEVMDSNRKRGKEYQDKSADEIAGELVYPDGVTSKYGVGRVLEELQKKGDKKYAEANQLILLLYLNLMAPDMEYDALSTQLTDLCKNFKEVWIMSGKHIACLYVNSLAPKGFCEING